VIVPSPSLVLNHDGRWKNLWLKYVQDVDLDAFGARALVGPYDSRISSRRPERQAITLDEHDAPLGYYLCGVSRAGARHDLHVAFTAGHGREVVERLAPERASIALFGVTRLTLWEPDEGDYDHLLHGREARYNTCRNWRHAVALSAQTS
jgi:hypothetical protein